MRSCNERSSNYFCSRALRRLLQMNPNSPWHSEIEKEYPTLPARISARSEVGMASFFFSVSIVALHLTFPWLGTQCSRPAPDRFDPVQKALRRTSRCEDESGRCIRIGSLGWRSSSNGGGASVVALLEGLWAARRLKKLSDFGVKKEENCTPYSGVLPYAPILFRRDPSRAFMGYCAGPK